ncbi:MAG: ATP-binding protein [Leifsonia sp.]
MTLGLPNHLIEKTMSGALARAANWLGLVCLAGALVSVTALSWLHPDDGLWPTILALIPMGLLLVTLARHPTLIATIGYLAVGTVSTYIYTVTILTDVAVFPSTDMFVVALPVIALVMVGGVGAFAWMGVVWSTVGLILGESAVFTAALSTGVPFRIDWFAPLSYVLIATVMGASIVNRGRMRTAQALIHQASHRDSTLAMRRAFEARSTALVHDTALNHLIAIAAAAPGPLDPRLRGMIARDLELLIGQDWLLATEESPADGASDDELSRAIDAVRELGLTVEVAGDRSLIDRLEPEVGGALALAVRQCLANVLRHSGVTHAEVGISAGGDDVVVMVTDAGRGFVTAQADAGKLGLRHSVRARIEDVGGSVSVFSQPGEGTSVILSVPLASGHVDAEVSEEAS